MGAIDRFTGRAEEYERWRPRYPVAVLEELRVRMGLEADWVVADVGSGTGIATRLFLDNGNRVFAVEPNDAMRLGAEERLAGRPGFVSLRGAAESTGLPPESVDLVVCAQSFHWFDATAARGEFARILRQPRWIALLWNTLHKDTTPFMRAYEAFLVEHCVDYVRVRQEGRRSSVDDLFVHGLERRCVPNEQAFDFEGLRGRVLSLSYAPPPGDPAHDRMLADLRAIFDAHHEGGRVRMSYDCEILTGTLDAVT